MMNKIIHFGSGNIGRGLVGQLCQESKVDFTFVDLSKDLVDKINQEKKYTITCLPSNKKIEIINCKAINLNDKEKLVEEISNADILSTSIGVNHLASLVDIINESLKIRTKTNKLILACFENGFKASKTLYDAVIEKDASFSNKLDYINIVVDRLVPNKTDQSLDVNVEDFYSVWYQKNNDDINWPLEDVTTKVDGDYQDFFNKKFYGVNGLHFSIAMIGYQYNKKYINETINDVLCNQKIKDLIEEMHLAIANLTHQKLQDIKEYLLKNVERFANKYLLDEVVRVARNAKQKISENERLLPLLNWLKNNNKSHNNLEEIIQIANKYIKENNENV